MITPNTSMPDTVTGPPAIAGGQPVRDESKRITYSQPLIGEEEIAAVSDCLRSRWIGLGPRVQQFEESFAEYKGAAFATAVNSGSAALHLALLAVGVGEGDEVIVPTMTFCASAHAITHAGAKPVLVDCEPDSCNIDPGKIEDCITPRTRAIMVVHIGGRCCDMDAVLAIAQKHSLRVVEDCAHAVESTYHGKAAGLIGDVGCFSFYATKSITTADGGMVITNSEDVHRAVRRRVLHGMSSDAWSRAGSKGNSYEVVAAGFKYNMTDVEAAIGIVQLKFVEERWNSRLAICEQYNALLADLPIALPPPPAADTRHAYHLYSVLIDIDRLSVTSDEIVQAMKAEHIGTGVHYLPLHMHRYYAERYGYEPDNFPVAKHIGLRTVSLPLNPDLTADDVADVCRALQRILVYYA